jgi:cytochrome c
MKSLIISMIAAAGLAAAGSALAAEVPAAAKKFECTTCHEVDKKKIGPSWMEISKFYNGKTEKTPAGKTLKEVLAGKTPEEWLLKKVATGGYGVWGTQPMLANNNVFHQPSEAKQEDIKKLVDFVLDLAK